MFGLEHIIHANKNVKEEPEKIGLPEHVCEEIRELLDEALQQDDYYVLHDLIHVIRQTYF